MKFLIPAVCIAVCVSMFTSMPHAAGIERSKPHLPSNEEMFSWASDVIDITRKHPEMRRMGTQGDAEVRQYILRQLKTFGFDRVEEQIYDMDYRHYDSWTLTVDGKGLPAYFMRGAQYTNVKGLSGELYYVGETIEKNVDSSGKIVVFDIRGQAVPGSAAPMLADFIYDPKGTLAKGTFGGKAGPIPSNFPVSYYQASDQGAIAMIGILKDYDTGTNKLYADPSAMVQARIPGLFMGKYDGAALIERINSAKSPLMANVVLRGAVKKSTSANIVATLKGQKKDTIIVNTHHDAGWTGGVQDGSGIAAVMGLAKYYAKIPSNFRQKNLVFVFDGNHYDWNYPMGANIFAATNPDVMDSTVLAIGIEHIAKKFVAKKEGYVDTGEIEPRILFTPPNQLLFDATKRAIVSSDLHDTIIPKPGTIAMFGETQSFFLNGVPSFSYISGPEYLFLADDTLDKIAKDEFEAVIKTFIQIIDTAMYLPGDWIKRIDR